jgi:hypothetical protein
VHALLQGGRRARVEQHQGERPQQLLGSVLPSEVALRGQQEAGKDGVDQAQASQPQPTLQLQSPADRGAPAAHLAANRVTATSGKTLATAAAVQPALPTGTATSAAPNGGRGPPERCSPSALPQQEASCGGVPRALHGREGGARRDGNSHLFPREDQPSASLSFRVALSPSAVAAARQAAGGVGSEGQAGASHMLLLPWEVLAWEQMGSPLARLAGCCDDV